MTSNFEQFRMRDFNNAEHLRLQKRVFKKLIASGVPELSGLLPAYRNAILAEDLSMQKIKGSSKSERLQQKDYERDGVFRSTGWIIAANTNHWDPTVVQAAKDLRVIYKTYKNTPRHNYQKESEDIIGYLYDMGDMYSTPDATTAGGTGSMTGGTGSGMTGGGTGSGMTGGTGGGNYLPAVQTLNLGPWLDRLRELNNEFINIYEEREEDTNASILLSEAEKTRQVTDKALRTCLYVIDMLVSENGYAQYEQLIIAINTMIRQWKSEFSRRQSDDEDEENENLDHTTNPNNGEELGGDDDVDDIDDIDDDGFGDDNTPSANA